MKPTKEQLFYFDCEWVPIARNLGDFEENHPNLYQSFLHQYAKKGGDILPDRKKQEEKSEGMTLQQFWDDKGHFYPEFCKIICVSYGYFYNGEFLLRSVYGDDEKKLMESIREVMVKVEKAGLFLCGYAIKRFDMPWLSKRMMANDVKPPRSICTYGKKPWEVEVFDLPEVWGQGNMAESFTPFELTCAALGLGNSKGDLDGSKVKEAYWNGEIERIKTYCEKDVEVSMHLASKLIDLLP
jgi:predicted PolB exonuclease-like 3'-5' exonuclease